MSELNRRGALRLFASLGAAGVAAPLLSACGESDTGDAPSKGTVKIGLLVPQSGANKAIGDDMKQGFELFRELNGGRLGGYDVEQVLVDEGETADSAKAAAEKLVKQDRVLAVTGVATSAAMLAVRDVIEAAHIPLIGSNASPSSLLSTLYIWRTSYGDRDPGAALGEYVAAQVGTAKTAYVIAPEGLGRDAVDGFLERFKPKKGRVEGNVPTYLPVTTNNFTQYLNPLKGSQAAAVVSFFSGTVGQTFVKQYFDLGIANSAKLYAPGFLTEGALLKAHGAAAKGIFTAMNYSPDLDNSANRRFASEYLRKHQAIPTTYAMASYDAASVLDKALAQVGSEVTGETLNAAIGRVGQISSPRGDWIFNQTRSPLQKWYLRQVRSDGEVLANTVVSELATIG